ncbi:16S rRNA (guanine(527)-N(7))-methyltransferase RsmG [Rhizobium sp. P32RR-XVIII]|uniref:16S rRNA (guanine(527)-N(7))-methyltransferase RsmG n=1 Tax=Rhizobium sp. P32RR-XVIII TaxID=2726738 RepID=UPI0014575E48|nr:16S rRNA (guanine(527)-N(7))-methyltransferase RsmG [Rhizobium sp. P32RR-XVIII]NLS05871.1 16S rRNA (guanine(527)-N(7))-methyltransferase RsmG [Rhizobium sp. P32RR-XVIII]
MNLNGQSVSRETQERLEHFLALFSNWAKSINLVAPSTLEDAWRRHVGDSAQIYQLYPGPKRWIDMGSGGGFPGAITAIFLAELGDGWVDLIESNKKKASFLRLALRETGARGSVHPIRLEAGPGEIAGCDAISARALAELDKLCEFSEAWMLRNENTSAYFHKGRDYAAEIAKARVRWRFDLIEHRSVVEKDSVILEISNLRRLV